MRKVEAWENSGEKRGSFCRVVMRKVGEGEKYIEQEESLHTECLVLSHFTHLNSVKLFIWRQVWSYKSSGTTIDHYSWLKVSGKII